MSWSVQSCALRKTMPQKSALRRSGASRRSNADDDLLAPHVAQAQDRVLGHASAVDYATRRHRNQRAQPPSSPHRARSQAHTACYRCAVGRCGCAGPAEAASYVAASRVQTAAEDYPPAPALADSTACATPGVSYNQPPYVARQRAPLRKPPAYAAGLQAAPRPRRRLTPHEGCSRRGFRHAAHAPDARAPPKTAQPYF